jgi:hypothetical protein
MLAFRRTDRPLGPPGRGTRAGAATTPAMPVLTGLPPASLVGEGAG